MSGKGRSATNKLPPAAFNTAAVEPLYASWEEPHCHRLRSNRPGETSEIAKGRRRSPITVANHLRAEVRQWREAHYVGASDTTRQLLSHWFERSHTREIPGGGEFEFRYYFCQREAIETLVYLYEYKSIRCLSQIVGAFGGAEAEISALGIKEEEDEWARYAFKLATGAGKTKVMSLAIVWSYFHALRESDSPLAKHFVIIAPGVTVYERLKEDFADGKIFDTDPLIPVEWRGDWNMTTVLQDEGSRSVTGGTIYLTNIQRLYDKNKRKKKKDGETYAWAGPSVSKSSALDTGEALRERITGHSRIMLLNDEAHHVWDPDSAWNEAIGFLHRTIMSKTGGGLVAQLDFSATPKDDKGQLFKHIVCDAPLGEAVDGGIVKTPIIGKAEDLSESADDNAAFRWEKHLKLGYERWKKSREEWQKSGKKPLLFVMCENTEAADQITQRLNTDTLFEALNGKTINLHTNLKGKLKKVGKGVQARYEFVESEKDISDEDLRQLRKLSRDLDNDDSQFLCIVSVLMLREGWDVRNVTTIVPLRPLTAKAGILPEQTLGRGLRRMTPPGQANELVTIVEHPEFAKLYQNELASEGLFVESVDVEHVPTTTVTIFPDERNKDVKALDIAVPVLSSAYQILPKLEGLAIEDVRKEFKKYKPLPLGKAGSTEIQYEGRHLITGEVVERMKIHLPLLESGVGAVSYYVKELETACKLRGLHSTLAPLVQTFLEEILFERKSTLFEQELISRLGNSDVAEHIRAVFVPLIRQRTTKPQEQKISTEPKRLSAWKPYQATHSETHPTIQAARTLFNLVPCNRSLEEAIVPFFDRAKDIAAFAKNAGPQRLYIQYLATGGRAANYDPDFMVRAASGKHYLVETKGRVDRDVPRKAKSAMQWCESASGAGTKWEYLYVTQDVFQRFSGTTIEEFARTCAPSLMHLIESEELEKFPLFAAVGTEDKQKTAVDSLLDVALLEKLSARSRDRVQQAVMLYRFLEDKEQMNFAPVFSTLLGPIDEAATSVLVRRLKADLPDIPAKQQVWFSPHLGRVSEGAERHYNGMASNLKKTLVFNTGLSPIGLLRNCLDYALNDNTRIPGVFEAVKVKFKVSGGRAFLDVVTKVNDFRNTYIAHQNKELTDKKLVERELKTWIAALKVLGEA